MWISQTKKSPSLSRAKSLSKCPRRSRRRKSRPVPVEELCDSIEWMKADTKRPSKSIKVASSAKTPGVLDDLLTLTIEPDEILYLVKEMTKRHDEGHEVSWSTQIGILADRYPRGNNRAFCIMERMQSLIEMMKDDRMRGWSMDGPDPKCNLTSEAVFSATALAPLHIHGHRVSFVADEFFEILLRETPHEGQA